MTTPSRILAHGLTLEEAFEKFARPRVLRIDRPPLASVITPQSAGETSTPVEVREGLEVIRDTIHRHAEETENRWARFREQMSSGRLVAAGYTQPRKAGEKPALIPRELWRLAVVDLSLSSLSHGDTAYEGIRVLRAAAR